MGGGARGQREKLAGVITGSSLQGYNLWLARPVFRYKRKRNHWINCDGHLPCINKDDFNWKWIILIAKAFHSQSFTSHSWVMWANILTKSGLLLKNAGTRTECYKGKYLCGKILHVWLTRIYLCLLQKATAQFKTDNPLLEIHLLLRMINQDWIIDFTAAIWHSAFKPTPSAFPKLF